MATGLEAGTYNVAVTDANGCTANASVDITEPTIIVIALDIINAPCFGENGGITGPIPRVEHLLTPTSGMINSVK